MDDLLKIDKTNLICKITWPPGAMASFPYLSFNITSERSEQNGKYFGRNGYLVTLYNIAKRNLIHHRGRGLLRYQKIVSMIRKYHNHKLQTTPWHREEEPLNHHETPGRQIKQSNQLSLPHQDDCNTRMDLK